VKLNVHERMALIPLLPTEDSFAGMGEVVRLKYTLVLTDEEIKDLVTEVDGGGRLDNAKAQTHIRDLPINEYMTKLIRKILREKDDAGLIHENELTIFEKFVLDYEQK
jgi:hypothetical protein